MTDESSPGFDRLLAGYRRFRATGWDHNRKRWEQLRDGQTPETMIIACSDSRVDPSQIFDVDPGEIFVVRNVAALVPPYETSPGHHGVSAALEFAVQFLRVKEVLVMGHGRCGGCRAALTQEMHGQDLGSGGFVANWISMLDEVREPIASTLGIDGRAAEQEMERAAVKVSLANLRTFPCIREKEARGTLRLRGALFAISDGILHVLDEQAGTFSAID
jgi:carbonic anhydrase